MMNVSIHVKFDMDIMYLNRISMIAIAHMIRIEDPMTIYVETLRWGIG